MTSSTEDRSTMVLAATASQEATQWHLITPEYPPQLGGVSDYTCQLAAGLASQGDGVHVWCPSGGDQATHADSQPEKGTVTVHRDCGRFAPADLRRIALELNRFPAPRRLMVQWVPHGYGYRSMNLAFCWWLYRRAIRHRDRVELMVHEPFLQFDWTSPSQSCAALVHRFMTILLLRATSRVWVTIPGWERMLRTYALGRPIRFQWLPIFSNIPAATDPAQAQAIRRRYAEGKRLLIGHFGTFGSGVANLLRPIILALGSEPVDQAILLMGDKSDQYRRELIRTDPKLESVLHATGTLPAAELSDHLAACDLLIQPYPDGASSRRGSLLAGLANGKPIVATTGWLTEPLWLESNAIALAPAGDTEAFLKQVRRLGDEDTERRRMGSAARRLYQERFDISRTIAGLRQAVADGEGKCAS